MRHDEKYLLINQGFVGKQRLIPFFNRQNNDDLILAIQDVGVARGRNGFRKDEGEEKLAESEEDLLQHRWHGRFRHIIYRLRKVSTKLIYTFQHYRGDIMEISKIFTTFVKKFETMALAPISDNAVIKNISHRPQVVEAVKAYKKDHPSYTMWEAYEAVASRYGISGLFLGPNATDSRFAPYILFDDGSSWFSSKDRYPYKNKKSAAEELIHQSIYVICNNM